MFQFNVSVNQLQCMVHSTWNIAGGGEIKIQNRPMKTAAQLPYERRKRHNELNPSPYG